MVPACPGSPGRQAIAYGGAVKPYGQQKHGMNITLRLLLFPTFKNNMQLPDVLHNLNTFGCIKEL